MPQDNYDEGATGTVRTVLDIFLMVVLIGSMVILFIDIAPNISWYARDLIQ